MGTQEEAGAQKERQAGEQALSGEGSASPANDGTSRGDAASAPSVSVGVSTPRFNFTQIAVSAIVVLAVLAGAVLTYRLLPILALVFVAILFATAIEPIVTLLRRGPFNRTAGILAVYTLIFLAIGLIAFLTVPIIISQVGELGTTLPKTLTEMRKGAGGIESPFMRQQVVSWIDAGKGFLDQFNRPPEATTPDKVANVAQTTLGIAESVFAVMTLFVMAFYWLTERTLMKRSLTGWLPVKRANRIRRVWDDIEVKVGGWVRGQLVLMLIIALASTVGYFLIGVQFWPAMALFIGLCEAIPMVGPYIGTAPAVLIALTQPANDGLPGLLGLGDMGGPTRGLIVVGFALVLQMVEGNVLVPRVMKNSVGISALAVILSLLIGATLAGLLGALIAVPIAGALQVILQDIREERELGAKLEEVAEAASTQQVGNVAVTVSPAGDVAKASQ
jgi:predicted PurR-regulated permease PerM